MTVVTRARNPGRYEVHNGSFWMCLHIAATVVKSVYTGDLKSPAFGVPVRFRPVAPKHGAFVYRLGHKPFTPVRGVRFPYALPERAA
jgi:hypothetical protein